ncbi:transposase [Mycolicibacter senuensis]|uniref:transposase n=1 Tax=Mycolicibacter senuensis TaxID=386913 RepID=UPI003F4AB64A
MARSRRAKVAAEERARLVLAVLAGEMTCAEAARRCGVTTVTMTKWKHQFLASGSSGSATDCPNRVVRDGAAVSAAEPCCAGCWSRTSSVPHRVPPGIPRPW